jgi:hypothetical protein
MTDVLNVAIGLALTFLLLSMLASAVQEALASLLNDRGKLLERAIVQMLDGIMLNPRSLSTVLAWLWQAVRCQDRPQTQPPPNGLGLQLLDHALLDGLSKGRQAPAYIPAEKFADALIDLLRKRIGEINPSPGGLDAAIRGLPPGKPSRALQTLLDSSAGDVIRFRTAVIGWYGDVMQRVSGWYTRTVRYRTFLIGLALAIGFQVNAIGLGMALAHNKALADAFTSAATKLANNPPPGLSGQTQQGQNQQGQTQQGQNQQGQNQPAPDFAKDVADIKTTAAQLQALGPAIGWSWKVVEVTPPPSPAICPTAGFPGCWAAHTLDWTAMALMLLGWIITALAVAQGAPFWFSLMSQLVNMRGAGVPPEQANPPAAAAATATVPPPWTPSGGNSPAIPLGMSADDLASVQRQLGLMATRVIDGRTTDAIRAYQIQHGLPSTGTLDLALAKRILAG